MTLWPNMAPARGHMFNTGLNGAKNIQNCLGTKHKASSLDIWCLASPKDIFTTFVPVMVLLPEMFFVDFYNV